MNRKSHICLAGGKSRAGVPPARRVGKRERRAGCADAGRRDACPTFLKP
jgi:hypothetical protein